MKTMEEQYKKTDQNGWFIKMYQRYELKDKK